MLIIKLCYKQKTNQHLACKPKSAILLFINKIFYETSKIWERDSWEKTKKEWLLGYNHFYGILQIFNYRSQMFQQFGNVKSRNDIFMLFMTKLQYTNGSNKSHCKEIIGEIIIKLLTIKIHHVYKKNIEKSAIFRLCWIFDYFKVDFLKI